MKSSIFIVSVTIWLLSAMSSSYAKEYIVNGENSHITFSGVHAGSKFSGTFEKWQAYVDFDSKSLANSRIEATFNTISAKTGNKMYDGTLPNSDWFNVKKHPQASFTSKTITKNEDGSYTAKGDLTIRAITQPIYFDFNFDTNIKTATMQGGFVIDRLLYNIGKKSDASAEWVSKNINVDFSLEMTKH